MPRGGDGGSGSEVGPADDVSMSVEETNKLRASLGLPPLKVDKGEAKNGHEEHKKRKREAEERRKANELEERVRQAKERRHQQEILSKTKTLGEADAEVDDVMAWVNKSRTLNESQQRQKKRQPKAKVAAASVAADDEGGDLAGAKVKHNLEDLEEGDEMILTLEDKSILDDKGNLIEEDEIALENVLKVCMFFSFRFKRCSRLAAGPFPCVLAFKSIPS